jgi:hypothetical protein
MLMKEEVQKRGGPMARVLMNPLGATQIKVVRRRVLQHDLDMYAAISGKAPGMPPAEAPVEEEVEVSTAARAKPWSASVLANYLGNFTMPRIAVRVVRPEVADWMRKLSNHALERLQEAQERLASARESAHVRHVRHHEVHDKDRAA